LKFSVSDIIIIGVKLFAICIASAIVLSLLNALTAPRILENKEKEEKEALVELVTFGEPGNKQAVDDEIVVSCREVSDTDQLVGYVLELRGLGSYGGEMKLLAVYKPDGELSNAKLMENRETPGLGKKAESDEYMRKFLGKGGMNGVPIPTSIELLEQQTGLGVETAQSRVEIRGVADFFYFIFQWFFGKPKTGSSDSVTGATVTFLAVSRALAGGSDYVKENLGGGK
jgi:electron transport complex protein RnfG